MTKNNINMNFLYLEQVCNIRDALISQIEDYVSSYELNKDYDNRKPILDLLEQLAKVKRYLILYGCIQSEYIVICDLEKRVNKALIFDNQRI